MAKIPSPWDDRGALSPGFGARPLSAAERYTTRYRKMQKSVYRVRTQEQISTRLALDMWREAHAEGRQQTLAALHRARAG